VVQVHPPVPSPARDIAAAQPAIENKTPAKNFVGVGILF
jgi:hypothetical protein